MLKQSADVLAPYIAYFVNRSIKKSVFPAMLKNALVITLHKKGPKNIVGNYKPILLLPSISKVFEKKTFFNLF